MEQWQELKDEHDELRELGRKIRYSLSTPQKCVRFLKEFAEVFTAHSIKEEWVFDNHLKSHLPHEIIDNIFQQHEVMKNRLRQLIDEPGRQDWHEMVLSFVSRFDAHIQHEDKLLSDYVVIVNKTKHEFNYPT